MVDDRVALDRHTPTPVHQPHQAICMRILPRPGTSPGRAASSCCAIRSVEKYSFARETVKVWRFESPTVAPQHTPQIVGDDIDHVRSVHMYSYPQLSGGYVGLFRSCPSVFSISDFVPKLTPASLLRTSRIRSRPAAQAPIIPPPCAAGRRSEIRGNQWSQCIEGHIFHPRSPSPLQHAFTCAIMPAHLGHRKGQSICPTKTNRIRIHIPHR